MSAIDHNARSPCYVYIKVIDIFMKNTCELSVIYAADICHVISSTNDAISFHSHNT